jgi:hypothetical protein
MYSKAEDTLRVAQFLALTHTSVEVLDTTAQSSGRILGPANKLNTATEPDVHPRPFLPPGIAFYLTKHKHAHKSALLTLYSHISRSDTERDHRLSYASRVKCSF